MGSHIVFAAIVCSSICVSPQVKVWDGDTVWVNGTKYRLADFDAPEYSGPKCKSEHDLAVKARERVAELLRTHKFSIHRSGKRSYERAVATFRLALNERIRAARL
jgi:endonuclease YncB( thermonuclease family)